MANLRVDKITSTETFEKTGSVQFDGTNDWLDIASSNDFAYGTGDFTWEAWFYPAAVKTTHYIFDHGNDGGIIQFYDGIIRYYNSTIGVNSILYTGGGTLDYSTWSHIAVSRNSGISRLFVNGQLKCLGPDAHSYSAQAVTIGDYGANSGTNKAQGFISNARLVKGTALYTSNFKTPMRELEVVPGTVLLACQSKTDASLEKTGKTITVTGNAVANELTPGILTPIVKSGGGSAITGSVEFDGTGDYLSIPDSTDFTLGTGDFTIEFWRYRSRVTEVESYITKYNNINSTQSFWFGSLSSGREDFAWYSGSSSYAIVSAADVAQSNEWGHLAAVRYNGDITVYLNGFAIGSDTSANAAASFNDDSNPLIIGGDNHNGSTFDFQGFISNLRVVKGTALYTADFIPPTRELKRVPGTVLLCCQDSNNPLTEATGKTITGYGDLARVSDIGELVQNGHFTSNTNNWTAINGNTTLSVDSNRLKITGGGSGSDYAGARQEMTNLVKGNKYVLKFNFIKSSGNARAMIRTNTTDSYGTLGVEVANLIMDSEMNATGTYGFHFTALANTMYLNFHAWDSTSSVALFDNISIVPASLETPASNFTPQVGDDRQVTFEGVTKINTENYFYFPTGDTESRTLNVATQASSAARGLFAGGYSYGNPAGSRPTSDVIDYITISSTGDALDFGDLTESRGPSGGVASPTRGVWMHGDKTASPYRSDTIDYVTISSKGSAQDFGNTIGTHGHGNGNVSNSTRGICGGGNGSPVVSNNIEYITIATTGNGQDFGDLTVAKYGITAVSSPTRGVFSAGDAGPAFTNTMDYITIQSMGNALDFGDGISSTSGIGGASNSIRGIFGNGYVSPYQKIDYITIASTGNAQSFGDLGTDNSRFKTGTSSPTRAVFAGGYGSHPTYPVRDDIEYVTIMSLGNAVDFGNLTSGRGMPGGCSNGHGGLG